MTRSRVFSAGVSGLIVARPPRMLAEHVHAAMPLVMLATVIGAAVITVAIVSAVVAGCWRIRLAERRLRRAGSRPAALASAPGVALDLRTVSSSPASVPERVRPGVPR